MAKRKKSNNFNLRSAINEYLQETEMVETIPGVFIQTPRYRAVCTMLFNEAIYHKNVQASALLFKDYNQEQIDETISQIGEEEHPIVKAVRELKQIALNKNEVITVNKNEQNEIIWNDIELKQENKIPKILWNDIELKNDI